MVLADKLSADNNIQQPSDKCNRKLFFLILKTYAVGTQKNRLNEMVIEHQNTCLTHEKNYNFTFRS